MSEEERYQVALVALEQEAKAHDKTRDRYARLLAAAKAVRAMRGRPALTEALDDLSRLVAELEGEK